MMKLEFKFTYYDEDDPDNKHVKEGHAGPLERADIEFLYTVLKEMIEQGIAKRPRATGTTKKRRRKKR